MQTDPNGLLYMRARYYNPYLCRFINPDPVGFSGGLNFFAYANGNPVSLIDPFGLKGWYDSWGDSVKQWVRDQHNYYDNNTDWFTAGISDTVIDLIGGIANTPQTLAHVGCGAGTFSADPSWANAPAALNDVAVAFSATKNVSVSTLGNVSGVQNQPFGVESKPADLRKR